ncbi:MAG: hypothetical protein Fur0024_3510 [Patescibacteria group bacterium]
MNQFFLSFIKISNKNSKNDLRIIGNYKIFGVRRDYNAPIKLSSNFENQNFLFLAVAGFVQILPEKIPFSVFGKILRFEFDENFYKNFVQGEVSKEFEFSLKGKSFYEIFKSKGIKSFLSGLWLPGDIEKKDYKILFPGDTEKTDLNFLREENLSFEGYKFSTYVFETKKKYKIGSVFIEDFPVSISQNFSILFFVDSKTGAPIQAKVSTDSDISALFVNTKFLTGDFKILERGESYSNYIENIAIFGDVLDVLRVVRIFFFILGTIFLFLSFAFLNFKKNEVQKK